MTTTTWVPEIMYEENTAGTSSSIPFIMVPKNENMPKLLYVFESRETEITEPNSEGDEVPVVEWDLHQYADMLALKNNLSVHMYDIVRNALGLEPLRAAAKKGSQITDAIRTNVVK